MLFILGMILVSGCYKDLGNYDYTEINQVQFSDFPTEKQYAFKNVDTLRVYPKLTGTLAKEDLSNYTYKWQAVMTRGSLGEKATFDLDSNHLNLEYFVMLPEAEYKVSLLVKDKKTGVTWRQSFDLSVTTVLSEGWLILSDVNGYCHLDMVSLSTPNELMARGVWEDSPLASRKGPRKIGTWGDIKNGGIPSVYLLSDDGGVRLDNDDFSYDPTNELKYEFGKFDSDFVPTDIKGNFTNAWRICVGKNGIYTKEDRTFDGVYGLPLNKLEGEDEYFGVAPTIGMLYSGYAYNSAVIFYDTTNQRFLQLTSDLKSLRLPTAPEKYFPYQTGKKFVYMASTLHNRGEVFTILKDNAGKHWLYGLQIGNSGALSQVKDHYFQIDAPDIEKATAFAIHPILYYLFYAVGNEIHQFDMTTKRHRILPIDFPEGESLSMERISMLKFNIFVLDTYRKPAGSAEIQYRLIVGSEEQGGTEMGGHVRMLTIPTSMEQAAGVYRSYSGFGKVVDVVYRERQ